MTDLEKRLQQYAAVLVRVGLNIQPGQELLIGPYSTFRRGVPIEAAPLVRAVAKEAYRAGAKYVDIIWDDPLLERLRLDHAPRDSFAMVPEWKITGTRYHLEKADAVLSIYAQDPNLMEGVDQEAQATAQKAQLEAAQPLVGFITANAMNWCVAAYPVQGWVDAVLPDVPEDERMERFWALLSYLTRSDGENPVMDWQRHIEDLVTRRDWLNARAFDALHYSGPGTDLTIGLPQGHIWAAAQSEAANGVTFTANVPTEEVFTLPHRDRVDGVVTATKPLVFGGNNIQDFTLRFEKGAVVSSDAKRGADQLARLLDSDEGARRLGEVALVPHSSPISQSGRLFYNILYDENASCHIALGRAYQFTIEGGTAMSDEDFAAAGGNGSLIHVDFMIGSGELDIDGLDAEGNATPIMRGGEWAFEV